MDEDRPGEAGDSQAAVGKQHIADAGAESEAVGELFGHAPVATREQGEGTEARDKQRGQSIARVRRSEQFAEVGQD